jgi:hypothetical protein
MMYIWYNTDQLVKIICIQAYAKMFDMNSIVRLHVIFLLTLIRAAI